MYWQEISPAWTLLVVTVASAPSAAVSTATTTMPAACAFLIAGPIALGSPGFSRIRSTPAAMKLSIWVTCLPRSYSKPTVVIFTLGLVFLASNSAPFDSATKNGLPIEPSETPIDLSSLAEDGAVLRASAIAAPASDDRLQHWLPPWSVLNSGTADQLPQRNSYAQRASGHARELFQVRAEPCSR